MSISTTTRSLLTPSLYTRSLSKCLIPASASILSASAPSTKVYCRSIHSSRVTQFARTGSMASILQSTAVTAHKAFANLASAAEVKAGDAVPDVQVKINDLEDKVNFAQVKGKNVLVLVPGAFSPTCSSQVPSYISRYDDFKSKGVNEIYVVSVNDMFVMQAWRQKLLSESGKEGKETETVKFVGDDTGALSSALGLVLDAQAVFGGPRLKRGAVVIEDGKVLSVAVEPSPAQVTVSHADEVYKTL